MEYFKDIKTFVASKHVFCGIDIHFGHWNLCFVCDGEVVEKTRIPNSYETLNMRLSKYSQARKISIVYEAGFSGFWLYRRLISDNYDCIVTPPSKMLKSDNKVKTDKRDAQKLAFYLSAGLLKVVMFHLPTLNRIVVLYGVVHNLSRNKQGQKIILNPFYIYMGSKPRKTLKHTGVIFIYPGSKGLFLIMNLTILLYPN